MPTNPLRDPRDRRLPRVPEPCALVVFGITGDLARKKLLPAVYDLANRGLLPTDFVLLGFARRDWGDVRVRRARPRGRPRARPDPVARGGLGAAGQQHHASSRAPSTTTTPSTSWPQRSAELEGSHGIGGNAAFYLSIPPAMFPDRAQADAAHRDGREHRRTGWRRVVVEKPFGNDLQSSRELNALVDSVFTADDVFRIDHYLGKETVQNLLALRFANELFEPVWNAHHVDSVQITMAEDVGIGGRAGFYEKTGAARDVLQNHLLQLLALTAMEEPVEFSAEEIRTEKLKVLRAISLPEDLAALRRPRPVRAGLAGRRSGPTGYRQEEGVTRDSTTETYAAVRLGVETRRWAGVPFYLRTGKRLPRRVTEIALVFKQAPHLPFAHDRHRGAGQQPAGHPRPARRGRDAEVRLEGARQRDGGPRRRDGLPLRRAVHRVQPGGLRAAAARRAARRRDAVPAQRRGRGVLGGHRPARGVLGRHHAAPYRAGEWGPRAADDMLAAEGRQWRRRDRAPHPSEEAAMTTLWDTTGTAVVKELAAAAPHRRRGASAASR